MVDLHQHVVKNSASQQLHLHHQSPGVPPICRCPDLTSSAAGDCYERWIANGHDDFGRPKVMDYEFTAPAAADMSECLPPLITDCDHHHASIISTNTDQRPVATPVEQLYEYNSGRQSGHVSFSRGRADLQQQQQQFVFPSYESDPGDYPPYGPADSGVQWNSSNDSNTAPLYGTRKSCITKVPRRELSSGALSEANQGSSTVPRMVSFGSISHSIL
jgi:hypothetical protein